MTESTREEDVNQTTRQELEKLPNSNVGTNPGSSERKGGALK